MHAMTNHMALLGVWTTWLTPLWVVGAGMVVAFVALFVISAVLRIVAPRVAAIAEVTAKEAISQPLFYVLLAIGVFLLLIFPFISYNTFGEDVKMLKTEGLTLIKVLSILLALWTASVSVAEEIEGRTALTLLSKPVRRWQFIFGKFLGIIVPVIVLFILLGGLFLASVSYKVVYDARETANPEPTTEECYHEIVQVSPGLGLSLMEAVVLVSLSVAISTRLPMLPNLIICFAIYTLGHLVPMLVNSSIGKFELVAFVGQLLAAILPVLDYFSMEPIISTGNQIPAAYMVWAGVYCLLFSTVAMLLALLLFEDRDLA